jgi:hypothetical protein
MMRKARKIRERLQASINLSEPVWYKPKGMHRKTFDRLQERERQFNNLSWKIPFEKLQAAEKRHLARKRT